MVTSVNSTLITGWRLKSRQSFGFIGIRNSTDTADDIFLISPPTDFKSLQDRASSRFEHALLSVVYDGQGGV